MLETLEIISFLVLGSRFLLWVIASMEKPANYSVKVFLAQAAEGFMLFFIFRQLFGKFQYLPFQQTILTALLGCGVVIGGSALSYVAKQQLGQEWVYASSYKKQVLEKVVTTGVYGVVRHPIYLGFTLAYVGAEILAGSWLWISFLMFLLPFYFQAKKEEVFLTKHFGKKYTDYQSRTKMLIPFVL